MILTASEPGATDEEFVLIYLLALLETHGQFHFSYLVRSGMISKTGRGFLMITLILTSAFILNE